MASRERTRGERERPGRLPQMALRHAEDGSLDDVVVEQAAMVRLERLDGDRVWIAAVLPSGERVAFEVRACRRRRLEVSVVETPARWRDLDSGELRDDLEQVQELRRMLEQHTGARIPEQPEVRPARGREAGR